ncbi:MAG: radical SAM protein, partial [Clostridia bacterium]|nr:radical SAM protein [Clostridia bacterium]
SGGEPFLHPEYLRQLNQACHSIGINTAVESCAHFDFETCRDIVADIDQLFFDIKIMDSAKHKKYTGQDNSLILENIAAASKINSNIIVRVPVIAGINDDDANMLAMCSFLQEKTAIRKVELLPYHKLGFKKMAALGIPATEFTTPDEDRMQKLQELIFGQGLEIVSFK